MTQTNSRDDSPAHVTPTVDVIIAARNEERYIGQCLDALKAQDYPSDHLQIHVVDNASTDETAMIAERRGAKVWRQPKSGAAAARNVALAKTSGAMVAFLDAHCIVEKDWVRLMTAPFRSEAVGGCQGSIENRSVNQRVQKYLDASGVLSNKRIIEDTVSGKRNLYPWILSGNCMYRRTALNDAGPFDENLEACEDVDLAWRVVLRGYQLSYVPQAKLIHMNCDSWRTFVGKARKYGRGSATLAAMYKPHGAQEKFTPAQIWSTVPERLLSGINYWVGYRVKQARLRFAIDSPPRDRRHSAVLPKFRPRFPWAEGGSLNISEDAIFWFGSEDRISVIVHVPSRVRIVLDSVADFIWREIVRARDRQAVIGAVSEHFGVASVTAAADLDEFVEELVESGILERKLSEGQPASSSLGP